MPIGANVPAEQTLAAATLRGNKISNNESAFIAVYSVSSNGGKSGVLRSF